jgi:hypothetical protein
MSGPGAVSLRGRDDFFLTTAGDGTFADPWVVGVDLVGGTVNLTGDVILDTFGALDDAKESNPDAASATIPSLLRGILKGYAGKYETVAASQTAQVIGGAGAEGDYLARVIIVPASLSPGVVTILDGATSINIFAGGAASLTELKPIVVELGLTAGTGPWKVTTGANVSVIATGNFT